MNDERLKMTNEGWRMKRGFASKRTDRLTDICDCWVAFATENTNWELPSDKLWCYGYLPLQIVEETASVLLLDVAVTYPQDKISNMYIWKKN